MKSRYAVREITTPVGSIRYEVSGYDAKGKQRRKRFKSMAEAEGEQHRLEMADSRVLHNSHVVQTRLTPEQIREAEKCFDRLPHGVALTDAVDRLVSAYNKGEKPARMDDALADHLDDMQTRGCRETTIIGTRSKVRRFIKENDFDAAPIDQIDAGMIRDWLKSLPIKSFSAYRLALSGLWTYAVDQKWCRQNVVESIKPPKTDSDDVAVLSLEQVGAMLVAAVKDKTTLAWTAVAIFGGLRPESELKHLQWSDIDFRSNHISVGRSKRRAHHRIVEMHPTLNAWLKKATGQSFDLTRADLKHVKRAAGFRSGLTRKKDSIDDLADKGLEPYPADVTRHTFGSFLYGRTLNFNEVADQMGNSVATVKRHYKVALPREKVEAFWNLTPENVLADKKLKAVG